MPVTITGFGVVLGKGDCILKKLWPSFYMGFGSIIGDGKQILSWVHVDDVVAAILFLLKRPELTGAFNVTSPSCKPRSICPCTSNHNAPPLILKNTCFYDSSVVW
jgi:NAD dependent epimerase/dehydratase family enzyme